MSSFTTLKLGNFGRGRRQAYADDIKACVDDSLPPPYTDNDSALRMNLTPAHTRLLKTTFALLQKLMPMILHILALMTRSLQLNLYALLPTTTPAHDDPFSPTGAHIDYWGLHKDDQGFADVLLSLASLYKATFPKACLLDLIHEADERPPSVLAQYLCSELLKHLDNPLLFQLRASNVEAFRRYIDTIFNNRKSPLSILLCQGLEFMGRATDILQLLSDTGVNLGWVDWHRVTTTQFALIIGFLFGENAEFVTPGISLEEILELATILAHRRADKARASLVCLGSALDMKTEGIL